MSVQLAANQQPRMVAHCLLPSITLLQNLGKLVSTSPAHAWQVLASRRPYMSCDACCYCLRQGAKKVGWSETSAAIADL